MGEPRRGVGSQSDMPFGVEPKPPLWYNIVKTLENRYPIFKAGEAAGTSMCRVLSMKSTVRPFHGPWGAYAPQG